MRKLLIAANWKMYKTPTEAQSFLHTFLPLVKGQTHNEIVICPPAIDLAPVVEAVKGSHVARRRAEHALRGCRCIYG